MRRNRNENVWERRDFGRHFGQNSFLRTLWYIFYSHARFSHTLFFRHYSDPNAERTLKEYEERNLAEYATALAAQVATEGNDLVARQLAGLCLKNVLVAKDDALLVEKHQAWKQLSPDVRAQVKNSLLQALRSSQAIACHTAAQAAAEVAAIELPYKEWPELVPTLLENLKTQGQASQVASLECLGFTCERITMLETPPIEESTTDAMLTTIVNGMQPSRGADIHLAAATAMRNSLVFADSNIDSKTRTGCHCQKYLRSDTFDRCSCTTNGL